MDPNGATDLSLECFDSLLKEVNKYNASNNQRTYYYQCNINFDELKSMLKDTYYIKHDLNSIDELINIICEYSMYLSSPLSWSTKSDEKNKKIDIINSNDNKISYAVVSSDKQIKNSFLSFTILSNELIKINDKNNINNKLIYRYFFVIIKIIIIMIMNYAHIINLQLVL